MFKKIILGAVASIFAAGLAYAGNVDLSGLGFSAPTISGKSNVTNPNTGEIIFDDSVDTFYGYNGTSWKEFGNNSVYLRASRTTSAQTFTNNGTVVFNSAALDSDSAYSTSTGIFTCPSDGIYQVSSHVSFEDIDGATNPRIALVHNDGSPTTISESHASASPATSTYQMANLTDLVDCAENETLYIVAYGDASFSVDESTARTRLSIQRISSN